LATQISESTPYPSAIRARRQSSSTHQKNWTSTLVTQSARPAANTRLRVPI